jgi:hypothetical protein
MMAVVARGFGRQKQLCPLILESAVDEIDIRSDPERAR